MKVNNYIDEEHRQIVIAFNKAVAEAHEIDLALYRLKMKDK